MKPEYQKEYEALGLPISNDHICALVESYLLSRSMKDAETMEFHCRAVNNYHALKSAVEELRTLVRAGWEYAIDLAGEWDWKRDTIPKNIREMTQLYAFIKQAEKMLKETEGLV
jgi:hypothetical protein